MRLFVSYARVDKPFCVQIVDMLDDSRHDVWFDHRIQVGQDWWEEITREVTICDGFVYLISPESVASKYCQKELKMAMSNGKPIFPIMIHEDVGLPDNLHRLQCADFTKGLTPELVRDLLTAIHNVELKLVSGKPYELYYDYISENSENGSNGSTNGKNPADEGINVPPFAFNPNTLITDVADATVAGDLDQAVFLLKLAVETGARIQFFDLEKMLRDAEVELERQSYSREAERSYKLISQMMRVKGTRRSGCEAFQEFHEKFPNYDPEGIANICSTELLPMMEWCDIGEGEVVLEYEQKSVIYFVDAFRMSKYVVTNAQFRAFIESDDGYNNSKWWDFSPYAVKWHKNNKPINPKALWGDYPRSRVSWYEAMAFCQWASYKTGLRITLPTEQQWQRVAQGDNKSAYPWGNRFAKARCNSKEGRLRATCPVTRYSEGNSDHGVSGMAGNIWEWCNSVHYDEYGKAKKKSATARDIGRAVRGGSFISVQQRLKNNYHFYLAPDYRYPTIGFRVVARMDSYPGN
jgi:hypothetical protein